MYELRLIFFLLISIYIGRIHAQTTAEKVGENWQLLIDGEPYEIKGATFGYDEDIDNYDTYFNMRWC